MAKMLKLSDHQFKKAMISMLKTIMDKVESMQEQIGNVNRDMEHLKIKKKCKKSKTLGLNSILNTTEEKRPALGHIPIKS